MCCVLWYEIIKNEKVIYDECSIYIFLFFRKQALLSINNCVAVVVAFWSVGEGEKRNRNLGERERDQEGER